MAAAMVQVGAALGPPGVIGAKVVGAVTARGRVATVVGVVASLVGQGD